MVKCHFKGHDFFGEAMMKDSRRILFSTNLGTSPRNVYFQIEERLVYVL